MTSFSPDMQNEKLAAILLVIVIVGSISVFLTVTYGEDILNALNGKKTGEKVIALGDCADVNYIGRYASNNTVFDSSYNDTITKTGGTPLKIFVSLNQSKSPPQGYEGYSSGYVEGLIEGLVGLKEGQETTIGPIPPEKAYGVKPKVGDIIDLTPFVGTTYIFKIFNIQENVSMPSEFGLGNGTTTLYTLRQDWHYVGEIVSSSYSFWENSTVVTKINETLLWTYTTPTTGIGENFTWVGVDPETGDMTAYPDNASSISFINDTTIIITHNPKINTMINVSVFTDYGYMPSASYVVEKVTADKINVSVADSTGNKSYSEFDRTVKIQRNQTQNITMPPMPGEYLEQVLFSYMRSMDSTFKLSYSNFSGKTLSFDVTIEKVYKTS
jgi:hypothetical protein